MLKRLLFLFSVLLPGAYQSLAQDVGNIVTDRPDLTESPYLVPKGFLQIETGGLFERGATGGRQLTLPTVLWKYSATDQLEFRLITETSAALPGGRLGLNPVWIGIKTPLVEGKGMLPKVGLIAHLQLDEAASAGNKARYIAPQFRFVFQHDLSDRFSLSYNLGMEWDGFTADPNYIYTLSGGFSLGEKAGLFLEVYGDLKGFSAPGNHYADGGLTYLLTPNQQVDVSAGYQYAGTAGYYFLSAGYSFRLNLGRKGK
jgi:hypothetical protein